MPTKKQLESELDDVRAELADARHLIEAQDREIETVDNVNRDLSERYGAALVEVQEERTRRLDLAEQYNRLHADVAALAEDSIEAIQSAQAEIEGLDSHNQYLVSVLGSISLYRGPDPSTPAALALAAIDEVLPEVVSISDGIDQ
jgi:chromosome segregation ATPase